MAKRKFNKNNYNFWKNFDINTLTFNDYCYRFRRIALSIFEWVNLPKSMNAQFLEKCLYYYGQAVFLKDKRYGFINTKISDNGNLNIYEFPTYLHCYSLDYQTNRKLYTGLQYNTEEERELAETSEGILVQNNWDRIPTQGTMDLFAYRLTQAERATDININAQKTPILVVVDEKQRLTMENLYAQYEGNYPVVFGDKNQLDPNSLRAIKTDAPFVADKLMDYKKEIWNEALTYLGINNIMVDKKERLVSDEANSNNELINLNLQSFLAPRKLACDQFNEKFGLKGTDKEIDVRVRSDLHNVIKNVESIVTDYKDINNLDDDIKNLTKGGADNGKIYDGTQKNL